MLKRKLMTQCIVCLVIIAGYLAMKLFDTGPIANGAEKINMVLSDNYTVEELFDKSRSVTAEILRAPAAAASRIIASEETRKYGFPADETPAGNTGPIYSVSGGRVDETGENDKLGIYVVIKHDGSKSVYGNCDRVYVKENEHVRKGQIIASFTNDGSKEFYYQLIEDL